MQQSLALFHFHFCGQPLRSIPTFKFDFLGHLLIYGRTSMKNLCWELLHNSFNYLYDTNVLELLYLWDTLQWSGSLVINPLLFIAASWMGKRGKVLWTQTRRNDSATVLKMNKWSLSCIAIRSRSRRKNTVCGVTLLGQVKVMTKSTVSKRKLKYSYGKISSKICICS